MISTVSEKRVSSWGPTQCTGLKGELARWVCGSAGTTHLVYSEQNMNKHRPQQVEKWKGIRTMPQHDWAATATTIWIHRRSDRASGGKSANPFIPLVFSVEKGVGWRRWVFKPIWLSSRRKEENQLRKLWGVVEPVLISQCPCFHFRG